MGALAAAHLVEVAESFEGHPYCFGGGHGSLDPIPSCADCSGRMRIVAYLTAKWAGMADPDLIDGSSETQFAAAVGGRVPDNQDLHPGDLVFFDDHHLPPPGHVGMCVTYNPKTRSGTYTSSYDTERGDIRTPFNRDGASPDGTNYMGATRVANVIPDPAPPKPPEDTVGRRLVNDPTNPKAWWLVDEDRKCGIPNPTDLATLQAEGIPTAKLTRAELDGLTTVPWGSL